MSIIAVHVLTCHAPYTLCAYASLHLPIQAHATQSSNTAAAAAAAAAGGSSATTRTLLSSSSLLPGANSITNNSGGRFNSDMAAINATNGSAVGLVDPGLVPAVPAAPVNNAMPAVVAPQPPPVASVEPVVAEPHQQAVVQAVAAVAPQQPLVHFKKKWLRS
jgi:hypothetical protein